MNIPKEFINYGGKRGPQSDVARKLETLKVEEVMSNYHSNHVSAQLIAKKLRVSRQIVYKALKIRELNEYLDTFNYIETK